MADDFDDLYFDMRNLFGENVFKTFEDIGKDQGIPIHEWNENEKTFNPELPLSDDCTQLRRHLQDLLHQKGYGLTWSNVIAIGIDGQFDNSLYKVRFNNFRPQNRAQASQFQWVGLGNQLPPEVPSEEWLACKFVNFNYYRQQNPDLPNNTNSIEKIDEIMRREGDLLIQLRHRNIVKAYAFIELPDRVISFPNPYMAIIMELMGGTLAQLLDEDGLLAENICRIFMKDILTGLSYLHWGPHKDRSGNHWVHISHNGVFIRNILFKVIGDQTVFKLGDFEVSRIYLHEQIDRFGYTANEGVFWGRDIWQLSNIFNRVRPLYNMRRMERLEYQMRVQNNEGFPIQNVQYNVHEFYPRTDVLLTNEWLTQY